VDGSVSVLKRSTVAKFHVEFEFRDLPGGRMTHTADVEASSFGTGINRAFAQVKKRPGFSGRKTGDRLVISVVRYKTLKEPKE
jgi:hypothetical protein